MVHDIVFFRIMIGRFGWVVFFFHIVCFRVWGALLGFPFLLARLVEGLYRLSHSGEKGKKFWVPVFFVCGVGACVLS